MTFEEMLNRYRDVISLVVFLDKNDDDEIVFDDLDDPSLITWYSTIVKAYEFVSSGKQTVLYITHWT